MVDLDLVTTTKLQRHHAARRKLQCFDPHI